VVVGPISFNRMLIAWIVLGLFVQAHSVDQPMPAGAPWILPASITITPERGDADVIIDKAVNAPFLLSKLTFATDVHLQPAEFAYLVELPEGQMVTPAMLKRAVAYLIKKSKFSTIELICTSYDKGVHLHMKLSGFWSFYKLKIHSFTLGKDKFRQYYAMELGEHFDQQKHDHAIARIKEALISEGYFNCTVTSSFEYDETIKAVTVHVYITKGDRFTVGAVTVTIESHQESTSAQMVHAVQEYVRKQLQRRMEHSTYSKKLFNKETRRIKRYLAKQGFLQADIELEETVDHVKKRVALAFTIELYRKKTFVFSGNTFFSDDDLLDRILLFGQSAWLLPISIVQQELEQAYRDKGFWSVIIQSSERDDQALFAINEGPQARIDAVRIVQVTHENAVKLSKRYFTDVVHHKTCDEALLSKAQEELLAWYVSEGFLDAAVSKKEYVPSDEPHTYILEITMHEGVRSYLTRIEIPGHQELLDQGPFLLLKEQSERVPFSMRLIDEQRQWLMNHFQALSYMDVKIKPEFKRDGESVTVVWNIAHNQDKSRFGKTVLVGSTTFPFEYIARELHYTAGDVWDKDKVRLSLGRLRELEAFEGIHLYPEEMPAWGSERPMLLKLQQDDPFEIRLRSGFAVQQVNKELRNAGLTYRVGGTFLYKNPFNWGDLFSVDTNLDLAQRMFVAQYQCPWLFNMPIRTTFQGYANLIQQPGLRGFFKNLYQIKQNGFLIGMNRKYKNLSASLNLGAEVSNTSIREEDMLVAQSFADNVAHAINFAPQLLNRNVPYFIIEPSLLFDQVDNKLQPSRGYFTLVTCRGMIPFGSAPANTYCVRLLAEQSIFVPCRALVLALRLRFGHVFHRELRNIPPNERFYLGGANSIRSYETDRCPPLGLLQAGIDPRQLVPQGGKTMINFNAELRFPIFNYVSGCIFQDLGALSGDRLREFTERDVLAGTGFGVRYNTPIGPLRFDIAWKWRNRQDPSAHSYAWFLTLGHAF
jgi:outer membrane protein assembly factor BamA